MINIIAIKGRDSLTTETYTRYYCGSHSISVFNDDCSSIMAQCLQFGILLEDNLMVQVKRIRLLDDKINEAFKFCSPKSLLKTYKEKGLVMTSSAQTSEAALEGLLNQCAFILALPCNVNKDEVQGYARKRYSILLEPEKLPPLERALLECIRLNERRALELSATDLKNLKYMHNITLPLLLELDTLRQYSKLDIMTALQNLYNKHCIAFIDAKPLNLKKTAKGYNMVNVTINKEDVIKKG